MILAQQASRVQLVSQARLRLALPGQLVLPPLLVRQELLHPVQTVRPALLER